MVNSFVDTTVFADTTYYYRIRGFADEVAGPYYNVGNGIIILNAPLNLSGLALNDQEIRLSWDFRSNIARTNGILRKNFSYEIPKIDHHSQKRQNYGFSIERKIGDEEYFEIASLPGFVYEFTDIDLINFVDYSYRIRFFLGETYSSYSNPITITTLEINAPMLLTFMLIDDQSVNLFWEDNCEFEDEYILERRTALESYEVYAVLPANTTQFLDEGLNIIDQYYYRVKAVTELNESEYSNEINLSTDFPVPFNLIAEAMDDQQIQLSWEYMREVVKKVVRTGRELEGFFIERKIGSNNYETIADVGADQRDFVDTGLNYGDQYSYRIRAYSSVNLSEPSNEVTLTTFFPNPSNLDYNLLNDHTVILEWSDNCGFELGYHVERKVDDGIFEVIAVIDENSEVYVDSSLIYNTQYYYRVSAFTDINVSDYSNEVEFNVYLEAPTNLSGEVLDDHRVELNWEDNCEIEESFLIEIDENNSGFTDLASVAADETSYVATGLSLGVDYSFRVKAVGVLYESEYSNEIEFETFFPSPDNLIVNLLSDEEIYISWNDNCVFETGYSLERKDSGSDFIEIASLAENTVEYTDSLLTYGLLYTYRIRAYSEYNYSVYSNQDTVTVIIYPPTNLTSEVIYDPELHVALNWVDNSDIETGFRIERRTLETEFEVINSTEEDLTEYHDYDVENLQTYYYRVCAFTENNQSVYSNIANATIIGE
jgi:hypothetical protein